MYGVKYTLQVKVRFQPRNLARKLGPRSLLVGDSINQKKKKKKKTRKKKLTIFFEVKNRNALVMQNSCNLRISRQLTTSKKGNLLLFLCFCQYIGMPSVLRIITSWERDWKIREKRKRWIRSEEIRERKKEVKMEKDGDRRYSVWVNSIFEPLVLKNLS